MASPRHSTTMENLPGEVLSDIFIRLLAKQLVQMRCVSKSWNALLSESSFVKSHLHRSIHSKDKILMFFHDGFLSDNDGITTSTTHSPDLKLTNFIKFPVIESKNGYGKVFGSVNGLICFGYISFSSFIHDVVYIWNPSLSALLTLPPCSLHSARQNRFRFGYGYDSKTDDYKVVKLTSFSGSPRILPEVEVYSMRKGSWELITKRFPSHITKIWDFNKFSVDGHDGHLHWLGASGLKWNSQTVVVFDLGAETFREIPLPHAIVHHNSRHYTVLGVFEGKLCVMSHFEDGEREMWMMDDYGVTESWAKHHAFSQFNCDQVPHGFTSDNKLLFRVYFGCQWVGLYDPIAALTKTFKIDDRTGLTRIVEYVDSLVWVTPVKREY